MNPQSAMRNSDRATQRTFLIVLISLSPCTSWARIGPLSSGLGSMARRCCDAAGCTEARKDGRSGDMGAPAVLVGVLRLVGVCRSSGIGVSGRSLKDGAVDGQLPSVTTDWDEWLLTSQRHSDPRGTMSNSSGSGSATAGVLCCTGIGQTTEAAPGREGDPPGLGTDKERFCNANPSSERSSLRRILSWRICAAHVPVRWPKRLPDKIASSCGDLIGSCGRIDGSECTYGHRHWLQSICCLMIGVA
jgi:hypothetical protein